MSLALVCLWTVSRTSGIPIGAAPWTPEPVGLLDAIASADEAVLAVLAGLGLRLDSRGSPFACLRAVAVLLILVSAFSLTQLGHLH